MVLSSAASMFQLTITEHKNTWRFEGCWFVMAQLMTTQMPRSPTVRLPKEAASDLFIEAIYHIHHTYMYIYINICIQVGSVELGSFNTAPMRLLYDS